MREGFRAKNATYMQEKKRSKTTYEKSLLELKKNRADTDEEKYFIFSLVSSFKKLNDK
jgi:hypothetical protein